MTGSITSDGTPLDQLFLSNPENDDVAIAYHQFAMTLKDPMIAIGHFKDAVNNHPDQKRLHHLYIALLLHVRDFEGAMKGIESFILRFGVDREMIGPALSVREKIGPFKNTEALNAKSGSISLCMIAKDEMGGIAMALSSVRPIVHEMVVVDTGSSDHTLSVAKIFGARTYSFTWTGSFSDARNFAMEKAKGKWIFSLDTDEVISVKDYSRFLKLAHDSKQNPRAISFITRNYTRRGNILDWQPNDGSYSEEKGLGWYPSKKVRLFPNLKGVRFDFSVHEKVEPSLRRLGILIESTGIAIHHYGPLNEARLLNKGNHYLSMGRTKVEEKKDVASLRELAVQAGNLEHWEEALKLWRQLLEIQPEVPEFYLNSGTALWHMGRYQEAFENAQKVVMLDPSCVEGYFNSGMASLFSDRADQAILFFKETLKRKEEYLPARFMLSITLACLQKTDEAGIVLDTLNRDQLKQVIPFSFKDVVERFHAAQLHHFESAVKMLALQCGIDMP